MKYWLTYKFISLFLLVMSFWNSSLNASENIPRQSIDEFIYRYALNQINYNLQLTNSNILPMDSTYYLGLNIDLSFYYNDLANNKHVEFSRYSDIFAFDIQSDDADKIIRKDRFPITLNNIQVTSTSNTRRRLREAGIRTSEFFHTRGLNVKEIRPEEVSVKVKISPFLFRQKGTSSRGHIVIAYVANQANSNAVFSTDSLIMFGADSIFIDFRNVVDLETPAPTPTCKGLLIPDYYINCSERNFSIDNALSTGLNAPFMNFSFSSKIEYQCYQPYDNITNFFTSSIYRQSIRKNHLGQSLTSLTPELSELIQVKDYCYDGTIAPANMDFGQCSASTGVIGIGNKYQTGSEATYSRMSHDIVGHDYFMFRRSVDYLERIAYNTPSNGFSLCSNDYVSSAHDSLFFSNNRLCSDVSQFVLLDRTTGDFRETDYFNLVEWDILLRVEPYYGDQTIPDPQVEDFFPVYRIRKPQDSEGRYINGSDYIVEPVIEDLTHKYFDYGKSNNNLADICNKLFQLGNFYSSDAYSYEAICPPIKLFYEDIRDEEGRKPKYLRYQIMVNHTYEDLRGEDKIIYGENGKERSRMLTFRSEILTELKAYPYLEEVNVEVTYPCRNLPEFLSGINGKGKIKFVDFKGSRPKICSNYYEGHSYEVYGVPIENCESSLNLSPEVISIYSNFYRIYKSANMLHHIDQIGGIILYPFTPLYNMFFSMFKRIAPSQDRDYLYADEIGNLSCGIYWIRAVTNFQRRARYGTPNYYRVTNGLGVYDVTPWNEPIVITPQDVAPVTLSYLPSLCDNSAYTIQAEASEDYVSNIANWVWFPPKQLDENGNPLTGEAMDSDKKVVFPGETFCFQSVVGVYENGCISQATIETPDFVPPLLDPVLLKDVLNISATKMKATWVKDFLDERFDDVDGYNFINKKNLYSSGQLGSYKILSSHDYLDNRVQTKNLLNKPAPVLRNDGTIDDVVAFNWTHPKFEEYYPKWVNNGRILRYNSSGQAIESIDIAGNYAAAIFGFDGSIPAGIAVNARNREIGFEGFEEYAAGGEVTPINNMMGNLDIFTRQDQVVLKKLRPYRIVAASGHFLLTDIPLDKYIVSSENNPFEEVIIEVEVPAEVSNENVVLDKSKSSTRTTSATIVEGFCHDYGLMLQIDKNIEDIVKGCQYWTGYIHMGESIDVSELELTNVSIVSTEAHTGKRSLKIDNCFAAPIKMEQNVLDLSEEKEYIISVWIKVPGAELQTPRALQSQYNAENVGVDLIFDLGGGVSQNLFLIPNGVIVDGWQKLEHKFIYPQGAKKLSLGFKNKSTFYLDDIRIFPNEGNMQTYVYDPSTYRLEAILDQNNLATIYKYDDEGKLFQVKKETAEGIKTLQINQSYLQPK